ncbi:MAG: LysR family transcriptional regulator [Sphingomonas sp.]|uniref:helix-turn-helix domain-containing protein n=1 Tax=Sphingomonas sp. TaxID=28214 RepID=UPI00263583B1|nr:LysR family transcriptional regulator [Sphingomonas sp.]MDK2770444.1 LysR family transcriptional regulator [Sphingomonas sp.]
MTIEVGHLRYLFAVDKGGSFRRAAKVLKVEQSAIGRRIRNLEERSRSHALHPSPL